MVRGRTGRREIPHLLMRMRGSPSTRTCQTFRLLSCVIDTANISDTFSRLRDFAKGASAGSNPSPSTALRPAREGGLDRCELCSQAIGAMHRHLFETSTREVICTCDPCALRFHSVVDGRFKLIPRDPRRLDGFAMTAWQWEQLSLPINLAFFVRGSDGGGGVRALYPSPAGLTESLLPLEEWDALQEENDELNSLESDVEALLVNRLSGESECFVTPIDLCYELTGLIRKHWRGLSGGQEVREEMDSFFTRLRARAR